MTWRARSMRRRRREAARRLMFSRNLQVIVDEMEKPWIPVVSASEFVTNQLGRIR